MQEPASQVDLHARASRERLARMVVSLLDHWELPLNDQAALLGLSAQSRSTIARYRRGELGVHKALRIMFPHDRDLAYRWISTPNRRFAGARPLDIMKRNGYEGILAVRRYLDFERGR
jgi:hypothetical protein